MTQNKTTRRIIKITLTFFGLLIAIPFCFGMYTGITSHTNTSEAIVKTLKEECDCKAIEVSHAAYGLQFSKDDGITTQKAAYILKDCNAAMTISETMNRVHTSLLTKVEGYEKMDVVQFVFEQDETSSTVEVNNGIIQ
ncbi:hypothetical protein G5B37_10615 [Rasiella rasia]|uniref:Uncharacterized protein n=1 Tax=Rasiella rasia TaxID=2744027 RepID=A0A6G6GN68_9FLAO|nr:hypothetical protein [Rasiella rasia]QIE59999.1 hypothetical protein G5B37_10615 [Rasiella rasia]